MPKSRIPNTFSPEEVRRAFGALRNSVGLLDDGAAGEVLVGTAVGSDPVWGTELTALTKITVDNITIDGAVVTSDTGAISFGDENLATSGTITGVNVTSGNDPGHTHTSFDFYNGTFRETFDALLSSDGSIVTLTLQQTPTGDLKMQFSDGVTTLDCTDPVQTIALTVGDDDDPQANYIYIPQATKVLTKSTSAWPAAEHIKVAFCLVPSAAFVDSNGGAYVNQNWNDHLQDTNSQGHLAHVAKKIRGLGATWLSGVAADGGTVSYYTIGVGTTQWISTTGVISQMHEHTFPIVDLSGSDFAIAVNDNAAAYTKITDLFSITDDNTGTPITNNRYFNLVFWGVINKTGDWSGLMVNLPGGFYALQNDALNDTSGLDVYDIPREFSIDSGTAFLIARSTFRMGSTWTHVSTVDLRGLTPATASGSSVNDHGGLGGLGDDDHTQYHNDTRAATWLTANHETTYSHSNFVTAYGWGDHAGLYDTAGTASAAVSAHESSYNHANFVTAFGWGDHASGGYLKADGSVPLTADWTTGAFSIIGSDHWYMRADSKYLYFGASDSAAIFYGGTHLEVNPQVAGSGGFYINAGTFGIGEVPVSHALLNCRQILSDNTQSVYGLRFVQTYGSAGSGNQSNVNYGLYFDGGTASNFNGTINQIIGAFCAVNHRGSNTLTTGIGLLAQVSLAGTGNITTARGLHIGINDSGAGNIANCYGIFLNDINVGTSSNFAIYSQEGIISFGDDVYIRADNKAIFFGTAQDASITYDGGDLILEPDIVGSGAVEIIGDMRFKGAGTGMPFAEIFGYRRFDTITITGTGLGNKVQITTFVSNGNRNQCTSDHSNDHVVVSATGRYLVTCSISADSVVVGTAAKFGFGVYGNNGTLQYLNLSHRENFAGGGGETKSLALVGMANLVAGGTIEAWVWNETNTDDIIIDNISLAIIQVGGSP